MSGQPRINTAERNETTLPKYLLDTPAEYQLAYLERKISQLNFLSWLSFGLSVILTTLLAVAYFGKNANPNSSLTVDIVIAAVPLLAAVGIRRMLRRYKDTETRIRHESTVQDVS